MTKRQPGSFPVLTILAALMIAATGCESAESVDQAFTNAILWTADTEQDDRIGGERSAILVRNGIIHSIVPQTDVELDDDVEIIDLDGAYVIPGLINAHGHVGMADGLERGPDIHSRELVIDQLRLYAKYGITTVVSLGDEPELAFDVRNEADPEELAMARFFLSGAVLNPSSMDDVQPQIDERMVHNPDWTKIRVDSQLGRSDKMPPEIYQALISASHDNNVPLAAHIVDLEDAIGVVDAGADLVAHSVRDQPVNDELIQLMLAGDICITPTLTREISVFIYADRPDFFDDPYFLRSADSEVIEQLEDPDMQANYTGESAEFFREALPLAKENMMSLHRAGVRVALGTDSGPPGRFQGYFEQLEMEMMQDAGMSPIEVLTSATRYAASCVGLGDQIGRLAPGYRADFVVLGNDPLNDIRNIRELEAVYIGAQPVDIDL